MNKLLAHERMFEARADLAAKKIIIVVSDDLYNQIAKGSRAQVSQPEVDADVQFDSFCAALVAHGARHQIAARALQLDAFAAAFGPLKQRLSEAAWAAVAAEEAAGSSDLVGAMAEVAAVLVLGARLFSELREAAAAAGTALAGGPELVSFLCVFEQRARDAAAFPSRAAEWAEAPMVDEPHARARLVAHVRYGLRDLRAGLECALDSASEGLVVGRAGVALQRERLRTFGKVAQ